MNDERLEALLKESLKSDSDACELTKKRIMKKEEGGSFVKILKRTAACVAAAAVLFVGAANSGYTVANAMYKVPVLGDLARAVTVREYKDTEGYFTADIKIPEAEGLGKATDELNRKINEYVYGFIEMYESDKEASGTEAKEDWGETARYDISNDYKVITDNDKYFSVEITTCLVMAGGTEFKRDFTVDKEEERVIGLSDIYSSDSEWKEKLTLNIIHQMEEQMANDEGVMYFIGDMGFSEITGDENFYITDDGDIVITFDEYEVAPGSMGVVSFNVGNIDEAF